MTSGTPDSAIRIACSLDLSGKSFSALMPLRISRRLYGQTAKYAKNAQSSRSKNEPKKRNPLFPGNGKRGSEVLDKFAHPESHVSPSPGRELAPGGRDR
jgi:hypothetical protein